MHICALIYVNVSTYVYRSWKIELKSPRLSRFAGRRMFDKNALVAMDESHSCPDKWKGDWRSSRQHVSSIHLCNTKIFREPSLKAWGASNEMHAIRIEPHPELLRICLVAPLPNTHFPSSPIVVRNFQALLGNMHGCITIRSMRRATECWLRQFMLCLLQLKPQLLLPPLRRSQ